MPIPRTRPARRHGRVAEHMSNARNRIHVMHGVNLDQVGRRDPRHYGGMTFLKLEQAIDAFADELDLDARFFQTNHEGEFIEELHRVRDLADGAIVNAGAWSHYSRAIGDALQFAAVPAVEVHLSDIMAREEWRHVSVLSESCIATIFGKGVDGYREALAALKAALVNAPPVDPARS
ncbi:MAG: type II 3-dehydroquinate dehydratase [Solirubrobacteraceae bacterium]